MATCRFCNAQNLHWESFTKADATQGWRLVDASNALHVCSRSTKIAAEMPLETRLKQDAATMESLIQQYSQVFAAQVVPSAQQAAKDAIAQALPGIMETAALIAQREALAVVPVEHTIVIKTSDGALKPSYQGKPHKSLQALVDFLAIRQPVFMVGPAGSGKTTAAKMAAEILGLRFAHTSMGPAKTEWDLLGFVNASGNIVASKLQDFYAGGGVYMLDELDNSNPNVLTALNTLIGNGEADFAGNIVSAHPDFVLVCAGNTYGRGADRVYVGRIQLDGATLDRFATLNWDYDEDAELDWAGRDETVWTRYVQAVRHKVYEHKMRIIVSPRASIEGARALRAGVERKVVEDVWLWKGASTDDRSKIEREVGNA